MSQDFAIFALSCVLNMHVDMSGAWCFCGMMRQAGRFERMFVVASLVMYALSCCLPVYADSGECFEGLFSLLFGVLGLLVSADGFFRVLHDGGCVDFGLLWNFVWLANPAYFLAIMLLRRRRRAALALSAAAVLLALSFCFCDRLIVSESGTQGRVGAKAVGYYLWTASFVVLLAGQALSAWLFSRPGGAGSHGGAGGGSR